MGKRTEDLFAAHLQRAERSAVLFVLELEAYLDISLLWPENR